jgi:hypothetical protein
MSFCKRNRLVDGDLTEIPILDEANNDLLRLEKVMLARDREADSEFDASARQLGMYIDDDMLWEQGFISDEEVRQEIIEEAGGAEDTEEFEEAFE